MEKKWHKINVINNRGFTLVEIIVVLVILAILAAFTVPAMLGFVQDAQAKGNIPVAREIYTAAQTSLTATFADYADTDLSDQKNTNAAIIRSAFKSQLANTIVATIKNDTGITTPDLTDDANGKLIPTNKRPSSNCVEVAFKYGEKKNNTNIIFGSSQDLLADTLYVNRTNAAKVWVSRGSSTADDSDDFSKYSVKAIWYVDKSGNYLIELNVDQSITNIYKKTNGKWSKI